MPFTKRILVVLEPGSERQSAAKRGGLIAERLGLGIDLLLPLKEANAEAEARLGRLALALADEGLDVSARRDWQGATHRTVLAALRDGGCGLVVKEAAPAPALEGLVTPGDWKLMRFAPCPVLLVKQHREWGDRPVLAAVDASPHDDDHRALNWLILQAAERIAHSSGGPLHLASAYSTAMQAADLERESRPAKEARYRRSCEALCDELGIGYAGLHIGEGPVEAWIAGVERDLDAAVVVMGTVARRGLQALLLGGNTAESILARLDTDVLCLKPHGSEALLPLFFDDDTPEVTDGPGV